MPPLSGLRPSCLQPKLLKHLPHPAATLQRVPVVKRVTAAPTGASLGVSVSEGSMAASDKQQDRDSRWQTKGQARSAPVQGWGPTPRCGAPSATSWRLTGWCQALSCGPHTTPALLEKPAPFAFPIPFICSVFMHATFTLHHSLPLLP